MALAPALRRLLWAGVVIGLLFYLGLTLWLTATAISFPYSLDYGEGDVMWFTHELALGHSIYKGLSGLPYVSSNYPPLAMLLAVPLQALFGGNYAGGRWLNLAAALIVAAVIFRLVRVEGREAIQDRSSVAAAGLSALFFLGSTFVYHWAPLFRVDLVGMAFTGGGILAVRRWERRANGALRSRGWLYLLLALALFVCAVYSKHSLLFAPAAATIALWLVDRRAALAFAIGFAVIAGGIFLVLNTLTGGGFAFGLITANATLWLASTFLPLVRSFLWTYLILIALAIWAWVMQLRRRRIGVLEIYALASLASIALAGRVGAWENYFFEVIFSVCVFAGIALAALLRQGARVYVWLGVLLLFQLVLFWPEHDPALAANLLRLTSAGNQQVGPMVRAAQGTIVSEDMGLLTTNGKPVEYYTFEYSNLARAGLWDQHWELDNLRAGAFPLVVLFQGTRQDVDQFRNFTREFVSALDRYYALKFEDEHYHVYAPSPLAHLQDASFGGKLELVGWSLDPGTQVGSGQTLTVTVVWRKVARIDLRYTAFAHLENETGAVAGDDHEPRVGLQPYIQWYPTTNWAPGEMVRDYYTLRLPSALGPGSYSLRVGWYDSSTHDRLSVTGGAEYVELTRIQVK